MYSRDFSDRIGGPPPEYAGTAWRREQEKKDRPPVEEGTARQDEGPPCHEEACGEKPPCHKEACGEKPPCREEPRREEREGGPKSPLLRHLPFGIREEDLLLLGLALLLLLDGCEDRYLPLVLLFLLIVH